MQYRTGQSDTPVGPLFEGLSVEGLWDAAPVEGQDSMLTKWRCPAMPVADSKSGDNPDAPVTFVLSTDEVDRHGDVISAEGWRLESYLRNPVLLWAHDYRRPAIGRAADVWSESRRLMARMEFAPTDFAQEIAVLYRSASNPSGSKSGETRNRARFWGCGSSNRSCWKSAPCQCQPTGTPFGARNHRASPRTLRIQTRWPPF